MITQNIMKKFLILILDWKFLILYMKEIINRKNNIFLMDLTQFKIMKWKQKKIMKKFQNFKNFLKKNYMIQ